VRSTAPAARHGYGRAESGFAVVQMVAEFRALRASVIHLWTAHVKEAGATELEELIRFDEAIDEAIAESLVRYSKEIDDTRQQFLAVLGHDLRNPLGAIAMSSSFLLESGALTPDQAKLVQAIANAEHRMTHLVADLLELAMSRMGDSMPVVRHETDLGAIVRDVVAEVSASYPAARIETRLSGSLTGQWDAARLTQALASRYGDRHRARGSERTIHRVAALWHLAVESGADRRDGEHPRRDWSGCGARSGVAGEHGGSDARARRRVRAATWPRSPARATGSRSPRRS